MEQIVEILKSLLQPGSVLLIVVLLLIFNSWLFNRLQSVKSDTSIAKRTVSFLLVLLGTLSFILVLPIEKSLKGQILSFLGIIISAGIALSSTTVLGNLIAGIMNNSMKRFRNGDLISVDQMQGRVTKKSIFHTEIQLEDSNFITIPNLYIATHPVKLTRKTNTVISTTVSLGYDVPRGKIEAALKKAASATGLNDPYVYITELGDYSVVYKVHGFLEDTNKYFSTISLLNGNVMDLLHEQGIEIVSPTFMNQRRVDETEFIPKKEKSKPENDTGPSPEELIFDEAIESEKIEKKKDFLDELVEKQETLKKELNETKDEVEIKRLKALIDKTGKQMERLEESIQKQADKPEKK
ncbi:mechanosensitive ion channel domain-containing protein [Sunxiuqinia dokdonensis]|uniref:Small mechanosensitive ion channel protein MscS n=1 Tax=Sunxiuqinia dokdonensis TaxID=1409788 RepID=A0A0L8VBT6_9BACT|nr:mechanosensitive ion channel domain-containing protein [Sunxiuqinia dokdonensis]KOH45914.1 hypothetical protein NC99_12900 [Sunxiuqinia dokdonensis]